MKTVVITGGAKGIGRGLAEALLAAGCRVAITGRDRADLDRAVSALDPERFLALRADASNAADVQQVWDQVEAAWGAPDIWINNAGYALTNTTLARQQPDDLEAMVRTNVLGAMLGCRVAVRGVEASGKAGAIYNILGAGGDGAYVPGMIGYGTTKAGVGYLTQGLAKELAATPIIVCGIMPGLVITEGWLREHAKAPEAARPARIAFANLIGEHVETSAAWIARIVLSNTQSGRVFRSLTPAKIRRRKAAKRPRDLLSRYF